MRPGLRRWLLVAALALAGLAAALWWASPRDGAGQPPGAAAPAPAAPGGPPVAPPPAPRATDALVVEPLPPTSTALAASLDTLQRLDQAGRADASCRLATEYTRCAAVAARRLDHDRWLAQRQRALESLRKPEHRAIFSAEFERELALREQALGDEEAHCEGVTLPPPQAALDAWRRAALGGNAAAVRQYATGRVFAPEHLLDDLDALARYRQEAAGLAEATARDGDLPMLLALASALSPLPAPERTLLAQAVEPDGARALALFWRARDALATDVRPEAARLRRTTEQQIAELEFALGPGDLRQARLVARDLAAGWRPVDTTEVPDHYAALGTLPIQGAGDCVR